MQFCKLHSFLRFALTLHSSSSVVAFVQGSEARSQVLSTQDYGPPHALPALMAVTSPHKKARFEAPQASTSGLLQSPILPGVSTAAHMNLPSSLNLQLPAGSGAGAALPSQRTCLQHVMACMVDPKVGLMDEVAQLLVRLTDEEADKYSTAAQSSAPAAADKGLLASASGPAGSSGQQPLLLAGLHEAQERGVLTEVHSVLKSIVEKTANRQATAQLEQSAMHTMGIPLQMRPGAGQPAFYFQQMPGLASNVSMAMLSAPPFQQNQQHLNMAMLEPTPVPIMYARDGSAAGPWMGQAREGSYRS